MPVLFVLKGLVSFFLIIMNTLICFVPVMVLALFKCILPFASIRAVLNVVLDNIATFWIGINNINQRYLGRSVIDVSGARDFVLNDWYMITANHQSWVDILILQRLFNRRIPFIKFFLKRELIWVPFIGLAWWALEFPFMKRYSSALLKKKPELKGKDIEVTKKACDKFQYFPVSIMNFLEGTRFTIEKHDQQSSQYKHLLMPKAGGLSFALNAMDGKLHQLIDVTIVYPEGIPSFFDYLCGKVPNIKVHIRVMPIDDSLLGNYQGDAEYRAYFQQWVNNLWQEKDQQFACLLHAETKNIEQ
ncbi:1-acyl-sn-glycerol-3-phosphate acyltransferase [Marinomonas polaris DSM 16579]|uniref:1-acyl-sn-glycerol-3-phosphate acyltransferase n=1 Tax=Marinomonas polaris DSM 16579 TaxID=1122206 RepID=A0A1M5DFK1_9GAMM|nr:acyltransferase [Marinomonas polaris]SHF65749.1 1-acyl-sn-glycerol-3-phosphate acyltransferase [Marinomonas polaris DSM 16579]